jgi:hypothetical protein
VGNPGDGGVVTTLPKKEIDWMPFSVIVQEIWPLDRTAAPAVVVRRRSRI